MAEIEKLMNIAAGDIEKIMGIETGDIETLMGVEYPVSATWTGTRAVAFGGTRNDTSAVNNIDYKSMSADTDTTDFGDLGHAYYYGGSCSNGTRAVYGGARDMDNWEYVTVGSPGNATDFGETTEQRHQSTIVTNGTIGIQMAGIDDSSDMKTTMDYINIASVADVTDWGDLSGFAAGLYYQWGVNHATRGLSCTGNSGTGTNPRTTRTGTVSFASTGNAGVENYLTGHAKSAAAGAESASRALGAGGTTSGNGTGLQLSGFTRLLSYFNTDSLSGLGYFGYLTDDGGGTCYFNNGVSDLIRAEFWAGFRQDDDVGNPYRTDRIDKFTIDSFGDATDVGNLASGASTYGPAVSSGT